MGSFELDSSAQTYAIHRAVRKEGLYEAPLSCLGDVGTELTDFERCNLFAAGNNDFGACTTTASGCRCHLDSFLEETLAGSYTTTSGSDGYATSLSLPGGQGAIEQTLCPSSTVMQVVVEELGMYPDTTLLVPGGGN